MIEWLYEFLGRILGKDDSKRRVILHQQRDNALSIFDRTKQQLNAAKANIEVELDLCNVRVEKKKNEIKDEELTSEEMANEKKKIDATVDSINKILGIEDIDE